MTATSRYIINHRELAFRVEIFLLSDDPYDQARFARRRRVTTAQGDAVLSTAEDVVITKLRWAALGGRAKDLADARNVILYQRDRLNWQYIHSWCDQRGTREWLEELRRELPPLEVKG